MKQAFLYIPALFFAPRVSDALRQLGFETRDLNPDDHFDFQGTQLVLVQLEGPRERWLKVIEAARVANVPVLAFGRHTEAESLRTARRAGASMAVPNAALGAELPTLVVQLTQEKPESDQPHRS